MTSQSSAERRMILSYVPPQARAGLGALLALDDALGGVLRTTHEPMIGQMRLTWWHDALSRLDAAPPPAEPVLVELSAHVLPAVSGAALAALVEGWEELLEPSLDDAALWRFGEARGGRLFTAGGRVLEAAGDPLDIAGAGWALADLAAHTRDPALAARADALAAPLLATACAARWSRAGRALGAITHLARLEGRGPSARTARALWHRLTGK